MYPLPRGANFVRSKFLWEIGLSIAGDPQTPYGGDRDMRISVGNGSGDHWRPWLSMATGSPVLMNDVAEGTLDAGLVNPSGFLTQAVRGVGLFKKPLPLKAVAVWPSWDRFVFYVRPGLGIKSLKDIRDKKYPLHVSVKEDTTHSTRVFIDQVLGCYGFSLADIVSWGGKLNVTGAPNDVRRMSALADGTLEAIFDEGLVVWFEDALKAGLVPIQIEPELFDMMGKLGWRRVVIPAGTFPSMKQDYACFDYGGWPLYVNASMPDDTAYKICAGIAARREQIPWEDAYTSVLQLGADTQGTPLDVDLHPGAARWYKENQGKY